MQFVIFHGSFGSNEGNWFPQLRENLQAFGQEVISEQFPVEDYDRFTEGGENQSPKIQNLQNWTEFFARKILPRLKAGKKICFIGHSIAPVFILHLVEKFDLRLDCAIFVSPFLHLTSGLWQYNLVNNSFFRKDFDFAKLKKLIPISYVLYSESDPYVSMDKPLEFASKLGSSPIQIKKAGHLNAEVNLNEFPLVLELCKSRLDLSLYQKYLAHRKELYSVDYIEGKSEEVIYIDPKEVFDEGVFHFRNLRKSGFCTLFTGSEFWDKASKFMQESRKAAQRVKDMTRVYIVEKKKNLKRKGISEQIKLDIKVGIAVYFCRLNDIQEIPEPDFGIWDGDYSCFVHFDTKKNANEVRLSSRKSDLAKAEDWKKKILQKSVPIKSETDIGKYIEGY